jgi:rhodanese-related sulfurtransferase
MNSPVTAVPPADSPAALEHFSGRLGFETDAADVAAALGAGAPGFVLLDARSGSAYAAGHLPGAHHLPRPLDPGQVAALPPGPVVVYCWGPGCNGAVKAAVDLARMGRPVKEMIGGFEYWVREGHPVEGTGSAADGGAVATS